MAGLSTAVATIWRERFGLLCYINIHRDSEGLGQGQWRQWFWRGKHGENQRMYYRQGRQTRSRDPGQESGYWALRGLKDLIGKLGLVNSLDHAIPSFGAGVSGPSIGHGGNLTLYICPESSSELHNQGPWIYIAHIEDQDLEAVQVIIHHLAFLVIGQSLQGVYCIHFHIHQKELGTEILIEVSLGLDKKGTDVQFLSEEVLGPLHGLASLEECQCLQDLFFLAAELLWGQSYVQDAEVEKGPTRVLLSIEVRRGQEFWASSQPCGCWRRGWWCRHQRHQRMRYGQSQRLRI